MLLMTVVNITELRDLIFSYIYSGKVAAFCKATKCCIERKSMAGALSPLRLILSSMKTVTSMEKNGNNLTMISDTRTSCYTDFRGFFAHLTGGPSDSNLGSAGRS